MIQTFSPSHKKKNRNGWYRSIIHLEAWMILSIHWEMIKFHFVMTLNQHRWKSPLSLFLSSYFRLGIEIIMNCCRGKSFCKTISSHGAPHAINTNTVMHIGFDDCLFFFCFSSFIFNVLCYSSPSLVQQNKNRLVGHGRMEHLSSSRPKQPIPIPPIPLSQWNFSPLLSLPSNWRVDKTSLSLFLLEPSLALPMDWPTRRDSEPWEWRG